MEIGIARIPARQGTNPTVMFLVVSQLMRGHQRVMGRVRASNQGMGRKRFGAGEWRGTVEGFVGDPLQQQLCVQIRGVFRHNGIRRHHIDPAK
jgi:hypothetical protein